MNLSENKKKYSEDFQEMINLLLNYPAVNVFLTNGAKISGHILKTNESKVCDNFLIIPTNTGSFQALVVSSISTIMIPNSNNSGNIKLNNSNVDEGTRNLIDKRFIGKKLTIYLSKGIGLQGSLVGYNTYGFLMEVSDFDHKELQFIFFDKIVSISTQEQITSSM
jgi:sRNA-binding regulator protein Hfq